MKKIWTAAAAVLALAACNKTEPAAWTGTELTAQFEAGLTRSHLDGEKVLWDAGDEISVFSLAEGAYAHSRFATAEGGSQAVFNGPGIAVDEHLYAVYPYSEANAFSAGTGFSIQGSYVEQKVQHGSFGPGANLAVGRHAGDKRISFRNVGALLRFTLTQERADTIRRIEIKTGDGTPVVFAGAASVQWNDGAPVLTPAADATLSDEIRISPAGETFVSGETYYVWVLPGQYKGITLTLVSPTQMTAVKTGTGDLEVKRNQIVDLGEIGGLTFKAKEAEKKTLHFDFSGDPLEGWPTADKWKDGPGELACVYPLDGVNYEFFLTECGNASQARVAWVKDKGGLVMFASWRYIGLPALEGFKLVRMSGVSCLGNSSSRKAGVVKGVAADNTQGTITQLNEFVTGGDSITWGTKGETYSYNLEDTAPGVRYYFMCTGGGIGVSSLDLVYEKVD